ncbi:urea transport system permease protein [Rhodoligotrophos appendicifer]|nr:urea ABC transporter permease subunit UrtB [Rhodoligotrophos appendicifer]
MFRILLLFAALLAPGLASAQDIKAQVDALGGADFAATAAAVASLGASGNPAVAPVLEALSEGDLYRRKSDGAVFKATRSGSGFDLFEPVTGAAAGQAGRNEIEKIRVNNSLRREIRSALAGLTLMSPDPGVRLSAANTLFITPDPDGLAALDKALAAEKDPQIRTVMEEARAAVILKSAETSVDDKVAAVATIAARNNREALTMLSSISAGEGPVPTAAQAAMADIEQNLMIWDAVQNIWYGISLGSVLLLAAIGLAITFGVMGVINMAHGEMVMIGAYTTFVVQTVIAQTMPGLLGGSVLIAIPVAFIVAGAIGIAIERSIIRFLYGRPLETLLATWGLSLILQQAIRTLFGPSNRQVGSPSWMSGAFELGGLSITWNRLYIVIFALIVFAVLNLVLRYTAFGLKIRAVTQNRRMAGGMGIRTPWVDAMTFGLGSGIAGMAGVALSQISNVSPNLGQGYIIDSFMVVVFGGVGNLWGTLVGAFTLGIVNKFLEPYAGAVLGKIIVLVAIILFIQRRPRGLFALKGRAIET